MKRIVLFVLMLVSVAAISQPANYLNIRSRYNLIAVKTDSGFHVPGYSTIPNYRGGVWTGSGNVGVDTVNNKYPIDLPNATSKLFTTSFGSVS